RPTKYALVSSAPGPATNGPQRPPPLDTLGHMLSTLYHTHFAPERPRSFPPVPPRHRPPRHRPPPRAPPTLHKPQDMAMSERRCAASLPSATDPSPTSIAPLALCEGAGPTGGATQVDSLERLCYRPAHRRCVRTAAPCGKDVASWARRAIRRR